MSSTPMPRDQDDDGIVTPNDNALPLDAAPHVPKLDDAVQLQEDANAGLCEYEIQRQQRMARARRQRERQAIRRVSDVG